jgi:hypothetical protein
MSAFPPGRGSHLGRRALVVLFACVLSSMSAGCGSSWLPVTPSALPPELLQEARTGTPEPHTVRVTSTSSTPSEGLIVTAYVCEIDASIVMSASGDSSRSVRVWMSSLRSAEASRIKVRETGCVCRDGPCTHLDVSDALVEMRSSRAGKNADRTAGIVVGSVLGAGVLAGLLYLLVAATLGHLGPK